MNDLEQQGSNFSVYPTYLESFSNPDCWVAPWEFLTGWVGGGCSPRICISDKFPGDTDAAGWSGDYILQTTGLEVQYPKMS